MPAHTERNFCAICRSKPVQVERLLSYPLVFLHLSSNRLDSGLEIKNFSREAEGAQLHLQKLPKDVMYRNQYIFGLPAEI